MVLLRIRSVWVWMVLLTVMGCASGAGAIYDRYPYLQPGNTAAWKAPAVLPVAPAAHLAPAPTLSQLVDRLLDRSPMIQMARQHYLVDKNAFARSASLPDLTVELTTPPLSTGLQDGEYRLEIMQMIPSPPAWIARMTAANAQGDAARWELDATIRTALTELYTMYADLAYLDRALALTAENQTIAHQISGLGATRYAQNQSTLVDVTRALAQLAQLEFDRTTLVEKRVVMARKLAAMVGESDGASWGPVQPIGRVRISQSEEQLRTLMLTHRPKLLAMDDEIRMADAMVTESWGMWFPDVSVGAMVMVPQGEADNLHGTTPGGTQTEVALMFGVSLPLWFHANAANVRQHNAELEAMIWSKKQEVDRSITDLSDRLFQVRNAERLLTLYDEHLLPRAAQSVDAGYAMAQSQGENPESFPLLLEARAAFYTFSLGRERALADLFMAAVAVEDLVGVPIISGVSEVGP